MGIWARIQAVFAVVHHIPAAVAFLRKLLSPVVVDQIHNIIISIGAIAVAFGVSASSPVLTGLATFFTTLASVSSAFNVSNAARKD
jgi:hypothetical protein